MTFQGRARLRPCWTCTWLWSQPPGTLVAGREWRCPYNRGCCDLPRGVDHPAERAGRGHGRVGAALRCPCPKAESSSGDAALPQWSQTLERGPRQEDRKRDWPEGLLRGTPMGTAPPAGRPCSHACPGHSVTAYTLGSVWERGTPQARGHTVPSPPAPSALRSAGHVPSNPGSQDRPEPPAEPAGSKPALNRATPLRWVRGKQAGHLPAGAPGGDYGGGGGD